MAGRNGPFTCMRAGEGDKAVDEVMKMNVVVNVKVNATVLLAAKCQESRCEG